MKHFIQKKKLIICIKKLKYSKIFKDIRKKKKKLKKTTVILNLLLYFKNLKTKRINIEMPNNFNININ